MGIKARVKDRVQRLVGIRELDGRLQGLEVFLDRLSAVRENDGTERIRTLEEQLEERRVALERAYSVAVRNAVKQASEEAFFRTNLNGVELDLPR
ncbi:MAG: hypothetical protein U0790_22885 [Isosphaeraceae bacterium]